MHSTRSVTSIKRLSCTALGVLHQYRGYHAVYDNLFIDATLLVLCMIISLLM
jgi:hypothetical protein